MQTDRTETSGTLGNDIALRYRLTAAQHASRDEKARCQRVSNLAHMGAGALMAIVLGLLVTLPAWAQDADEADFLDQADQNGDGVITCQEARDVRMARFLAQDVDQDQSLDRSEFRAALPSRANWLMARIAFSRFDTDDNGRVDQAELSEAPLVQFEKADTDGDCRLTPEELDALRAREGL